MARSSPSRFTAKSAKARIGISPNFQPNSAGISKIIRLFIPVWFGETTFVPTRKFGSPEKWTLKLSPFPGIIVERRRDLEINVLGEIDLGADLPGQQKRVGVRDAIAARRPSAVRLDLPDLSRRR